MVIDAIQRKSDKFKFSSLVFAAYYFFSVFLMLAKRLSHALRILHLYRFSYGASRSFVIFLLITNPSAFECTHQMEWTNQRTVINDYVIEIVYDWKIVCWLSGARAPARPWRWQRGGGLNHSFSSGYYFRMFCQEEGREWREREREERRNNDTRQINALTLELSAKWQANTTKYKLAMAGNHSLIAKICLRWNWLSGRKWTGVRAHKANN